MYTHPTRVLRIALGLLATTTLVFFAFGMSAHAQTASSQSTQPTVVATVNIYDAKIVSQQGNTFAISFDLSNREGAQPGIRYAVQLTDSSGNVADETVYPDVTNLESHSDVVKNIQYTAPAYLSGTYQLMLVSENMNGLTLAHATLDPVNLSGTGSYMEILPSTCFLTIAGEAGGTTYTLDQGVDIAQSETLNLTCTVKNHSKSALTLTPSFETFYRDVFGQPVQTAPQSLKSVSAGVGASATFTVPLPKASVPQAYDVKLSFASAESIPSNSVTAHYVLRGESATIQNLTLDKTSYGAGDTALISLFWTGSASNFFGARAAPGSVSGMQAVLSIAGNTGSCGSDVTASLDSQRSTQIIPFPITGACDSPKVSVRLVNGAGNVLASSAFDFQSTAPSKEAAAGGNMLFDALLAIAVLALLYGAWRVLAGKTLGAGGATLVVAGLCIISYGLPGAVHADTFTEDVYLVSSGGWQLSSPVYYDVNLNKSVFSPGETITAAGNVRSAACGNSLQGALTATINTQHKDVFRSHLVVEGPHTYHVQVDTSFNTFTAENTPGNYVARFYPELHVPTEGPGAGSYFSVGTAAGGCGTNPNQVGFGGPAGGCLRGGGGMARDWLGTTPYEMPYTVSGPSACVPTSITCNASTGNLQDNCGSVTTCQYGCSTATNQCNTSNTTNPSCTPTSQTCQLSGNLVDNCGDTTACQSGCSTQTNTCNLTCQPRNVCNANATKVVNSCTGATVEDCASEGKYCSGGQCISPVISFISFDAFDLNGNPFTATGHIQAFPPLLHQGDTSRIYWDVSNAHDCTVTGNNGDSWSALFSGSSGKTTSPITAQTTYTLLCNALTGAIPPTVQETATVNIIPVFIER